MGNVFNTGLFGHNKSGKTTLGEAMLFAAKAIERMGETSQGNTTLDYDEEETRRLMSVNVSVGHLDWKGRKLCLVDTPGYMDFVGEQVSGLQAADSAMVVISADSEIGVGVEELWSTVQKKQMPALIFLNKTDLPNLDFAKVWADVQKFFGTRAVLVTVPEMRDGKLAGVTGVIGAGESEHLQRLTDSVAELDDAMMEKYLESGTLAPEDMAGLLKKGILEGKIVPVLCGSAAGQIGVENLLDFIVTYMPAADDLAPAVGKTPDGQDATRERTSDAPLSGIVFKTVSDPFIGRLSYLRIFSGKMAANAGFFNATKGTKERAGQLLRMQGKKQEPVSEAGPGDIIAVAKLSETGTFDSFSDQTSPIIYPVPAIPEGAVSFSITPKVKGTEDKLGNAIGRITEEDPTIKVFRDNETSETIITGMGDLHLDVTINRFRSRYGVEVEKGIPKIAYKETVTANSDVEGKFKRQTGGRGQYGHCFIKVEPLPRGTGFEFVDEVVGGSIPRNFIPSVEKGVREAMGKGVLAGFPVVDVRVRLYDGSYHTVDSSDIAFQVAGSLALQKGVQQARPILLEPIVNVDIRVPQEFVGDIIGSINAKRGRVLDMGTSGSWSLVKVQVPLAEMSSYTSEIRSITSGKGSYSLAFAHYEVVPGQIAEKIIEERKKNKEEKA